MMANMEIELLGWRCYFQSRGSRSEHFKNHRQPCPAGARKTSNWQDSCTASLTQHRFVFREEEVSTFL
jgi:hypothetical protein